MATKKIDPRLHLPPIEGFEYADNDNIDREGSSEGSDLGTVAPPNMMFPPDNLSIVEHVFRKAPDGRTVVDLVIEVQDVPRATEYEIRTSVA